MQTTTRIAVFLALNEPSFQYSSPLNSPMQLSFPLTRLSLILVALALTANAATPVQRNGKCVCTTPVGGGIPDCLCDP
ncbi:hypothetical protein B0H16DRAFT_1891955 [Mycena metata]|uniref:Uncharacterized protein n=1 Tax=Mycena metata TaxID=1033252 RepID=A0AAD7I6X7_9AGAR|nr:hypothetical protein B0H16DRAFT_1891955 [Mycena metata]